ncbi:MAG: hypothetical protein Q9169_005564 [Polycauliona sp. 2 TL-2023]
MGRPEGEPKQKHRKLMHAAQSKVQWWRARRSLPSMIAGAWKRFLVDDAKISRKAFDAWFSDVYLQGPHGGSLSKDVKQQIFYMSDAVSVYAVNLDDLLPGTLEVLKIWERVDLVPKTPAWNIARARLIGQLLVNGLFADRKKHGLEVTNQDLAEARIWLHKKPDGTVSMFAPFRQLWHHKGLYWTPGPDKAGTFTTFAEIPTPDPTLEMKAAEQDRENPEALRISTMSLQRLMVESIESETTSTTQSILGAVAPAAQLLDNVAERVQSAAYHPHEHTAGQTDVSTGPARNLTSHTQESGDSDRPVITLARSVGPAEALPNKETDAAEQSTTSLSSTISQPAPSIGPQVDLHPFVQSRSGESRSTESGMMTEPFRGPAEEPKVTRLATEDVQATNYQDNDLLEVSEDEEDDHDAIIKMEDIPWDYNSQNHPRFQQEVDAEPESNTSDKQDMERNTDDHGGRHHRYGSLDSFLRPPSSTPYAAPSNIEEQGLDVQEIKTKEEAVAFFASRGYPDPERSAAHLWRTERWHSGGHDDNLETADSEATTEILDRDDDGMAGVGGVLYDEQDKENRPMSDVKDELDSDGDDRLEVRITEDMYEDPSSEDELAVDGNGATGQYQGQE